MKISDGMHTKLEKIKARYAEVGELLSKNEVICDQEKFRSLSKEHSDLEPIVEIFDRYLKHKSDFDDLEEMIAIESDQDMKALEKQELDDLRDEIDKDGADLKIALLPKDPNEDNNVIMEIRAGAGGDEAALFGTELMKMYRHYAENNRWKVEEVNMNFTELGGAKELVFLIAGKGAWGKLKFESGVHRVQRVPETESQGRVHTSTVTVAVLPEAQDVEVNLNENDIKVDTYRSGGAGGQHVNKTESAVRMTHLPTGLVAVCQDERSQQRNREKCFATLKARILDFKRRQEEEKLGADRLSLRGSGDRSERIRTYNFPQNRITDHRIDLTLYALDRIIDGALDPLLDALAAHDLDDRIARALK